MLFLTFYPIEYRQILQRKQEVCNKGQTRESILNENKRTIDKEDLKEPGTVACLLLLTSNAASCRLLLLTSNAAKYRALLMLL